MAPKRALPNHTEKKWNILFFLFFIFFDGFFFGEGRGKARRLETLPPNRGIVDELGQRCLHTISHDWNTNLISTARNSSNKKCSTSRHCGTFHFSANSRLTCQFTHNTPDPDYKILQLFRSADILCCVCLFYFFLFLLLLRILFASSSLVFLYTCRWLVFDESCLGPLAAANQHHRTVYGKLRRVVRNVNVLNSHRWNHKIVL